ncbi:MAG: DUF4432 family protein [Anaerolineae bacterium]|nr:DUF4432 family protein [Thermoflexales bacterium]MDW8407136.1 DUF4432 family protein [Anaerolineae bacterium]
MTPSEVRIHLSPELFAEKEKPLVEHGSLCASMFRFASGVCGVTLKNEVGCLTLLPYQGQQIWSAQFGGRDLTMKSMFDQPRPTRAYLETYGGFFLHCGFTAMGVPSHEDSHPLHGELPNAPYQTAYLCVGQDAHGNYIGLGGAYRHTVAFNYNYLAEPIVKLYAGSSLFHAAMVITNLKRHSAMEYMYLAHINFRPVDNGRLVYSAPCTPERVRVRRSIPSHVRPKAGYREFIEELGAYPDRHNVLKPDLPFDPEVVFTLTMNADAQGWAHSMQVHPDGTADYVAHRPDQLDKCVRWISRTGDQDACGFSMPATAEPEGYHAEKAKGHIKTLEPLGQWRADFVIGVLDAAQTKAMEQKIAALV